MSLAIRCRTCGPVALAQVLAGPRIRQRAEVVDQRVDPDVDDLVLIPRNRDTPRLSGSAEAEVLEPALDEAPRLVSAEVGQDEVRPLVVELQQRLLVAREPEEVVLLLDPLRDGAVLGTLPVHELVLVLERLAADAVETRVGVLVDVAVVVDPLDELLDESLVALIRRADEEVDAGTDLLRDLAPLLRDLVDVDLRIQPLLFCDAVHLRRVLVRAGEEERVLASLPVMAHEDVRRERRVRMPDVRRRVDVVDRCRQVEGHGRP